MQGEDLPSAQGRNKQKSQEGAFCQMRRLTRFSSCPKDKFPFYLSFLHDLFVFKSNILIIFESKSCQYQYESEVTKKLSVSSSDSESFFEVS